MIKFYTLINGKIDSISVAQIGEDLKKLIWIDLIDPSSEDEKYVEQLVGIDVPTKAEMQEIEVSSRFYFRKNAIFATSTLIVNSSEPEPSSHAVTFILKEQLLITVRYSDPKPFQILLDRINNRENRLVNGSTIFIELLETIVDRIADILEDTEHKIGMIARNIFRPSITDMDERNKTKPDFEEMLRLIAINADIISKVNESLSSLNRLISFISQTAYFNFESGNAPKVQFILNDILPMNNHGYFLSNKINFLLDATLGMINIEQNNIIKIFSVAAVVFLPPTLVASIYGMNFEIMPELKWPFGYPFAIMMMVLSSFVPYKYFKWKKWF